MDWDDLRWLLVVVRSGSAASAARTLQTSASTVTRRIAALEEKLGTTLFLRSRDGLRPTETARRLFEAALRVEAEMQRAHELVAPPAGEVPVRLATTEGLATLLVERGLLELRGVCLELLAGNATLDLAGGVDLALRLLRPRDGEVRVRKLGELALWVCAGASYIARRGAPSSEPQLAGHEVLLPSGELAGLPEARWLEGLPGVRVALRTSSMPALMAAARAGHGLAVLPGAWAQMGGVQALFPAPVERRALWLAFAPDAAGKDAVRRVADRIAEIVTGTL
jgi:DNA-binding transcriptional LysR family regulator